MAEVFNDTATMDHRPRTIDFPLPPNNRSLPEPNTFSTNSVSLVNTFRRSIMTLQDKKSALVKMIMELHNDRLIDGISEYLKNNLADFWNDLSPSEREEMELGLKQLDEGKGIDLEDYLRKVS